MRGARILAENTRDEQRKMINYHHLIASLLIFHDFMTMTRALYALIAAGKLYRRGGIGVFQPFQTEHINRLAATLSGRDRRPESLERIRILRMPPRSEGR